MRLPSTRERALETFILLYVVDTETLSVSDLPSDTQQDSSTCRRNPQSCFLPGSAGTPRKKYPFSAYSGMSPVQTKAPILQTALCMSRFQPVPKCIFHPDSQSCIQMYRACRASNQRLILGLGETQVCTEKSVLWMPELFENSEDGPYIWKEKQANGHTWAKTSECMISVHRQFFTLIRNI